MTQSATATGNPAETKQQEAPRGFFQHTGHVKLGWLYLRKYSLSEALPRISECLQMFAAANGAPELYNETLTWSYVILINERMTRLAPGHEWREFADGNPDLFDWQNSIVKRYYRDETLNSEHAKRTFVMPDLQPLA